MNTKFKYGTVTEAMNNLRQNGFSNDFRIEGNQLVADRAPFNAADLKIAVTYRYEGHSDPGDEATVYGLESRTGVKGILVVGDGIYADAAPAKLLKRLHLAKNEAFATNN